MAERGPDHSTVRLAKAFAEIPGCPRYMIERAVDGYYHDYLSELALPELQLVADARDLSHMPATPYQARPMWRRIAERVIDGEFDAGPVESDEWAASADGQATLGELPEAMRRALFGDK